jgi:hypothetical protein
MGHAILRKDLVRNFESASIPQFLNESFDDVFCWLHSPAPYSNFNPIAALPRAQHRIGIQWPVMQAVE